MEKQFVFQISPETGPLFRISELVYALYRENWVSTHTDSALRKQSILDFYQHKQQCLEEGITPDSFEDYIFENGFGSGSLYVCFEEFCAAEYLNKEFVSMLLGYEPNLIALYDADIANNSDTNESEDIAIVSQDNTDAEIRTTESMEARNDSAANRKSIAERLIPVLYDLQRYPEDCQFPCPRCGRNIMDKNPLHNALSRRASVYVCDDCGTIEAANDWSRIPDSLEKWAIAGAHFGLDWTADDVEAVDIDISLNKDAVTCTFETQFDWEEKFGISQANPWTELYARYRPSDDTLSMWYCVFEQDGRSLCRCVYAPTDDERTIVLAAMEKACQREVRCSLAEAVANCVTN